MSQHSLTPVDFNPFEEGVDIQKIVFTNEPQKEIWLSCAVGGNESSLAYNESVSLHLKGDFHTLHFSEAIQAVVARHEALRSSVSPNGENLFIYQQVNFATPIVDLSTVIDQQAALDQFTKDQMQELFDLEKGPLFRTFLHKLNEQHYYFTLVIHHIIGDGWSLGVILEDLSQIYNGRVNGKPIVLDEAPQISQYAREMTDFERSPAYQKIENYWLEMYKGDVPVMDLPTDYPRPAKRSYKANRFDQVLPDDLIAQVKKTGAQSGASLVNTLLSAFEVLLYHQTNQRDIIVGLPTAGQAATGLFGLVAHCVNLLPLKSSIDPNLPFNDYLKRRKGAFFDAFEHQQFTFGQLIKKLNIPRDHSRIPLVPIVFNIDMGMDENVVFEHLNYTLISNPRAYETFEIFLNATHAKSSFTLEWSYNTQLFSQVSIAKMAADFEALLIAVIADPAILIKDILQEKTVGWKKQLATWNNTANTYPKNKPFTTLIDQFALSSPHKTALRFNQETFSYAQLVTLSNQFASWLISEGIVKGDIIGLLADRSARMVISLLGILKAGATYVPLDPEYPAERIDYMLDDAQAKMLILSKAYSGQYKTAAIEKSIEDIWLLLQAQPDNLSPVHLTGSDLAYILYTSGSTGKPKGVKIMHSNLINFLTSMQLAPGITDQDRLLAITTISFDIAGLELYLPLVAGAELIISDQDTARDGRLLLELIEAQKITIMQATPATWRMMLDSGWEQRYALKILCGGEALPNDLASQLVSKCTTLWNVYGPTETTIWSTIKQINSADPILTIGRPIHNTQVYILNENHQLVAPGTTGEICIGGDGVAAGYLNQPQLSNERFIDNPFSTTLAQKLYKTGDLGKFLDNGELLCLGRVDQQVKIRGYRIELGEIESQLALQDSVKQAVVVAREDIPGNKSLVAYVTLPDNEVKDNTPSWKDRWDTLYDIAATSAGDQDISDQKIDANILVNVKDKEKLAREAEEWLAESVARIKKFRANRVLELGSGAGQILFEIAPQTQAYVATDYAQTAIDKLQQQLDTDPQKWKHVIAKAGPADDYSSIPDGLFDLIIIHSVAQYFPDTSYFLKVITEAVKRLEAGGCLFIGDMQGKNSLEMHHAFDHLSRSKSESNHAEFEEIVQNRVKIEDEFVADPSFFYLLPQLIPEITGVDVQLRRGKSINETTKYHYDVWIYVNTEHQVAAPPISLNWSEVGSMDALLRKLQANLLETVEIKNIFNSRTAKDHTLLSWLRSAAADAPVKLIKEQVGQINTGVHPDLFWQMGEDLGFEAHVRWTTDGTDGNFDVVFIPAGVRMFLPAANLQSASKNSRPGDFARTPLQTNEVFVPKSMLSNWKESLQQVLPDYMVPTDFVALKEFPLTPNFKIDKKALPKPQSRSHIINSADDLPHTKNEQLISDIWSAVLGLENINIKDDFFELGGHSLLAVKVMASIEKETGKRLPLATLFENATIEKLAIKLQSDEEEKWGALVPIKPTGSKDPVYLIHGAGLNILLFKFISGYLDKEQPVYGLQAAGLSKPTPLLYSLEEISALYISEVLEMNPKGPYCLVGYSSGGFIAFEMARQLIEMGKEVKFVGIVDSYAGDVNRLNKRTSAIMKKMIRQFKKIPFIIKSFIKYPNETISYQLNYVKYKLNYLKPNDFHPVDEHISVYEREIQKSYNIAHGKYILSPAELKVSLFSVNKRLYYIDDPIYLGWNKFAKKGVDIYHISGDHITMLAPPNDQEFARILQDALNKC